MALETETPSVMFDDALPPYHPSKIPYAIGNGKAIAFIDQLGTVVWWDVHNDQTPAIFMDLVAPGTGGYFKVDIRDLQTEQSVLNPVSQGYVGDTNVLQTRMGDEGLEVEVLDFMPPDKELLIKRIVLRNNGDEERYLRLNPHKFVNPEIEMSLEERIGGVINRNHQSTFSNNTVDAIRTLQPGTTHVVDFIQGYGTEASIESVFSISTAEVDALYSQTISFWKDFSGRLNLPSNPEFQDQVARISLGLMLLIDNDSGAAIASPTTSLPAVPWAPNLNEAWDYRAIWLRDGRYVHEALLELNLTEEARDMLDFFYRIQGQDGSWKPMYSRNGGASLEETLSEHHTTYDGVAPVKYGNAARDQLQLDAGGQVLVATKNYVKRTNDVDYVASKWQQISDAADYIMTQLDERDHGPWEVREGETDSWVYSGPKHFTYSKVMMFAGLNAAAEMAQNIGLDEKEYRPWQQAAAQIKEEVLRESWSDELQSFVQAYVSEPGKEIVDILSIAMVRHGMIDHNDSHWQTTEQQLWAQLEINGGMKRHSADVNSFYPATFKFAQFLADTGRPELAHHLLTSSLAASNNGILGEQHRNGNDPAQLGNLLLGWSHAAAIKAAFAYDRAME